MRRFIALLCIFAHLLAVFPSSARGAVRVSGGVMLLGGGAGVVAAVAAGTATCVESVGGGCVATFVAGGTSADFAGAGLRQLITGQPATPLGQQVFESIGLTPGQAAFAYALLNLGAGLSAAEAAAIARTGGGGANWQELSGMLQDAAKGKGNFSIGNATREQSEAMGKAWVGSGYRVASDGSTLVSADGLKQYRPPSLKPNSPFAVTGTQSNFQQRSLTTDSWTGNAHLNILD